MATEPRISLNKLGEYLTASPLRRKELFKISKTRSHSSQLDIQMLEMK